MYCQHWGPNNIVNIRRPLNMTSGHIPWRLTIVYSARSTLRLIGKVPSHWRQFVDGGVENIAHNFSRRPPTTCNTLARNRNKYGLIEEYIMIDGCTNGNMYTCSIMLKRVWGSGPWILALAPLVHALKHTVTHLLCMNSFMSAFVYLPF